MTTLPAPSGGSRYEAPVTRPFPSPGLVRHDGWPTLVWRLGPGWRTVSSAILGGGLGDREWLVNMQVQPGYSRMDPARHLTEAAAAQGLDPAAPGVGLMTAAQVDAYTSGEDQGVRAWATTGIGIPVWAAAPEPGAAGIPAPGTINIVAALPVPMSDAALVNAVATATEAKVQALIETGYACTGTPSDAICIAAPVAGPADEPELFGGPRSVWGARLARAVHAAVAQGARDDRVRRSAREGS
ncbi:adenosylcobinamide amidohydrolase [Yinghuangia soli]|uniref:Adenosylcobinamide amidohydrolase n=1 Tax=Yinghuangia soli TaxID=2908204 RepID=A0AA41PZL6_9ACTN|nr:adenosylcobinamide amidohydrolase [Yinghuangia soli]MCF2528517.1 adenosylcobinamide amidohydrolase [Yinghuangia soli]